MESLQLKWVADYEAVGRGMKPRRRHLDDCGHFYEKGTPEYTPMRLATDEEMATVPPCETCLDRSGNRGPTEGKPGRRRIPLRDPDQSRATKRPNMSDLDRHLST